MEAAHGISAIAARRVHADEGRLRRGRSRAGVAGCAGNRRWVLGAVPYCHGVEHRLDIADALGRLKTPADAWRFIQDFAAGWATPITGVDGFTGEAAGATLGVRRRAAVRAAYRLFGRRADLTGGNGRLWRPDELRHDQDAAASSSSAGVVTRSPR